MRPVSTCTFNTSRHGLCGALFAPLPQIQIPKQTNLSVDGVGAYDHVLRSTMLERLMRMPTARGMLPFVRLSCGTSSRYSWVGRHRQTTFRHTSRRRRAGRPTDASAVFRGDPRSIGGGFQFHGARRAIVRIPRRRLRAVCAPEGCSLVQVVERITERIAASGSIRGRLGSGTGEGLLLKMLPYLEGTLGNQTGSKFSGLQWEQELPPQKGCVNGLLRNSNCGMLSLM